MKKIFYTFFSLFIYAFIYAGVAFADGCPTNPADETTCTNVTGCIYKEFGTEKTCTECNTGEYRTKNQENKYVCTGCTKRPADAVWIGNGGDSDNCRWEITCPNKPGFEHGIWEPDSPTATGTGSTSTCTYNSNNITCYTTGNPACSYLGYHLVGERCVPDVTNCTTNEYGSSQNGLKFDGDDTCYVSSCPTNKHLVPSDNNKKCGTTQYGTCTDSKKSCADVPTLTDSCSGGTVEGDISVQISGNVATYTNYTNCRCTKTNQPLSENGQTVGRAKIIYNYKSSGELDAIVETTVTSCIGGYCKSDNTCTQAPAGKYSPENDLSCHPCTAGATSNAGSTAKTDCHYNRDTVFRDSGGGTFMLPVDNIKIEWPW